MRETLACVGAVIAAFWLGHYSGSRRADPTLPPQQQRHGRALALASETQQFANNCSIEQARQSSLFTQNLRKKTLDSSALGLPSFQTTPTDAQRGIPRSALSTAPTICLRIARIAGLRMPSLERRDGPAHVVWPS